MYYVSEFQNYSLTNNKLYHSYKYFVLKAKAEAKAKVFNCTY